MHRGHLRVRAQAVLSGANPKYSPRLSRHARYTLYRSLPTVYRSNEAAARDGRAAFAFCVHSRAGGPVHPLVNDAPAGTCSWQTLALHSAQLTGLPCASWGGLCGSAAAALPPACAAAASQLTHPLCNGTGASGSGRYWGNSLWAGERSLSLLLEAGLGSGFWGAVGLQGKVLK